MPLKHVVAANLKHRSTPKYFNINFHITSHLPQFLLPKTFLPFNKKLQGMSKGNNNSLMRQHKNYNQTQM